MRHDVEHIDAVVCIQVAGSEVITVVAGIAVAEQVVDALLQVADIHQTIEIDIAHVVEEVGVEVRGLVLRIGIAALRNVAAGALPRTVARDGEIVGTVVVHRERVPVDLALYIDFDVVGISAGIGIVEDDRGQRREESLVGHVAHIDCCCNVGNGLTTDVHVLDVLGKCRPDGREAVLMYIERLQCRQCVGEGRDITCELVALQVEVFECRTQRLAAGEPLFHLLADVSIKLSVSNFYLLHLGQGKQTGWCLVGIQIVDAGARSEIDFLDMSLVPLHTKNTVSRFLHALDEFPVGCYTITAATGPRVLRTRRVVGGVVEFPKQCKIFVGNLLHVERGYIVKGGRFVVRTFLELQRDAVAASRRRHRSCLVVLRIGIINAVVAHALKPIYVNSFRTARQVGLAIQAGEVDEVLRHSLLLCRITLDDAVIGTMRCPRGAVLVAVLLSFGH